VIENHHVIPQQRIKIARSAARVKLRHFGRKLSDAEYRLISTPLERILADRRNIVLAETGIHHRLHHGARPLRVRRLPRGIEDFAREYALESALEHELRLLEAT
jgi:hypothetical protein